MRVTTTEVLDLETSDDVVRARQTVRNYLRAKGFSSIDETRLVTAASELSRNVVDHGGGGTMSLEVLEEGERTGIRLTFEDRGPGILDIDLAMTDGFSTRGGLGLGLGGAKRLVNEFAIHSEPGVGTRVTVLRWR